MLAQRLCLPDAVYADDAGEASHPPGGHTRERVLPMSLHYVDSSHCSPEVIAIGGGVSRAGEFIPGPAREEVQLRARSPSRDLVEIKEATLGPESGVLGAAALARGEGGEYVLGSSERVA